MSKIASWIFPFGGSSDSPSPDPIPLESSRQHSLQYLPPPKPQQICNPCNQEPWVPIASRHGLDTVIGFVHPHQQQTPSFQYGPPSQQYGPPSHQYGVPPPPTKQYGPPQIPNQQYGLPPPSAHQINPQYGPPSNQYGAPHAPTNHYGPPAPTHQYGPPPTRYGVPNDQQGHYSNKNQNFRPPPNYIPPTFFIPPPTGKSPPYKYTNVNKPSKNNKFVQGKSKPLRPALQHQHGPPIPLNFVKASDPPPYPFEHMPGFSFDFRPPSVEPEVFKSYAPILTNYDIPLQLPHLDALSQTNFRHSNQESVNSVQLIPSIRVADFISTIEHPIKVIQSPIVEVHATSNDVPKVEENVVSYGVDQVQTSQRPIDTQAAATAQNATYYNLVHEPNPAYELQEPVQSLNLPVPTGHSQYDGSLHTVDNTARVVPTPQTFKPWSLEKHEPPVISYDGRDFSQVHSSSTAHPQFNLFLPQTPSTGKPTLSGYANKPVLNFADWIPNISDLSTVMVPPPLKQPSWATTKKPKHVQIIIPYRMNDPKGEASGVLPIYTQPPAADRAPVWSHFALDHSPEASGQIFVTAQRPTESVLNIRELVTSGDPVKLQKSIDGWTEQEFSNTIVSGFSSTSGKLIPSKKIPSEYLTTHAYGVTQNTSGNFTESTSTTEANKDIDTNLILTGSSTTEGSTNIASMVPVLSTLPNWEQLQLSISPLTKEKIYVVTPQPWKFLIPKEINEKLFPFTKSPNLGLSSKFSVVINGGDKNRTRIDKDGLKVVYSEWPHLINKLMTTTTDEPKSTGHPLFGQMDLTSVTDAPNSTVVTLSGHSKVVSGATTTASAIEKKPT
ncbi:uncharacterized protein LOC116168848 isoform X2 [Photinus pyralis]|nr:uncharacterized protein LOC116168848 isoform X2 [Photinus pyralis]